MNFWTQFKKPIMVLAPMADVTDAAFRRIIAKYGKPDVMWTEFVSADGLLYADEKGKEKLLKDLEFSEGERPIIAQFFTAKPEMMRGAAELAVKLGFDGIDINMGCPVKRVQKQGSCSALIKTPKIAREMIREAKAGARRRQGSDGQAGDLPVSVKTRLGFNKDELETWLPELLAEEPALITMHARTQKDMSKVPARWERIKRAVEIRDELKSKTFIFGNGDLVDLPDAERKVAESGADGAMFGRAIFGNPWLFDPNHKIPTVEEKLRVAVEHTKLFEELLGGFKNFSLMKKHYKAYVNGFDGAKELRVQLMEAENALQVGAIINNFLKNVAK